MTLDINPMVICSYHHRAVIVPLLKAKTSNTCDKAAVHSNITLLVCSNINSGVANKFHCEVVIKTHEYLLLIQGFYHKFPCFSVSLFQSMLSLLDLENMDNLIRQLLQVL